MIQPPSMALDPFCVVTSSCASIIMDAKKRKRRIAIVRRKWRTQSMFVAIKALLREPLKNSPIHILCR